MSRRYIHRTSTTDVMLDIETLGTSKNAVISTIAAIKFSRTENIPSLKEMNTFYKRIDQKSCTDLGMIIDNKTLEWWRSQPALARYEALENPDRISITQALEEFNTWLGPSTTLKIWAKGIDFDCVILGEAYRRCNLDIPWKFWNVRDLRTLLDIGQVSNFDLPKDNLHDSLHDCYRQIIGLRMALSNIRLK